MDKKLDSLNRLSGRTLSLTSYGLWELTSYGTDSLFSHVGGCIGPIRGATARECIDNAIQAVKEKME